MEGKEEDIFTVLCKEDSFENNFSQRSRVGDEITFKVNKFSYFAI